MAFAVIMLLIGCVAVGLVPINLFFAKDNISNWVLQNTHLELEIDGPLRIRLGPRPRLTASNIRLASSDASSQSSLQAENLLVRTRLASILHRKLDIRELQIDGIVPATCHESGCPPEWLPEKLDLIAAAPFDDELTIEVVGESPSGLMTLSVSGDSLNELLDDPAEYPFELDLQAFSSDLRGSGKLHRPPGRWQLSAGVELASDNLSHLLANFGLGSETLGKFSARSELVIGPSELAFHNLMGTLDENSFALTLLVQNSGLRPRIEIDGQFDHLDLAALAGNGNAEEESAIAELELEPYFNQLLGFDGNIDLKVGRIMNVPLAMDELAIQARLDQGLLRVDRADIFLSGSLVEASGELDLRQRCPQLKMQLLFHELDLQLLEPWLTPPAGFGGNVSRAENDWTSCGNSVREHIVSMQLESDIDHLQIQSGGRVLPLEFDSIRSFFSWTDPGQASITGGILGESWSAEVTYGDIETILSGADWPLSVSALGSRSYTEISGTAALGENEPRVDIDIKIGMDRLGSLQWLGFDPENQLPFSVSSRLAFGPDGLLAEDLDIRLGRSDIRGKLDWPGPDSQQAMTIQLRADEMNVTELAGLFPETTQAPTGGNEMPEKPGLARIENWLRFPSAEIDLGIGELSGLDYAVHEIRVQTTLHDRLIENGRLQLQLGKAAFDGAIQMDFRESPGRTHFRSQLNDVDIGRTLADLKLAEDLKIRADHIELQASARGDTLAELAEDLQVEARMESFQWVFAAGPQHIENHLDLEELDLLISPGSQSIWRAHGEVNDFPLRAFMRSPSLQATFDRSKALPLTLILAAGNDITMLEGLIDRRTPGDRHARVTLSGGHPDQEIRDFSMLESPLNEFEITSDVTWRDQELLFSKLLAKTGESTVTGSVNLRYLAPRYQLDVDLHSPFIETDNLVQFAQDYRDSVKLLKKHEEENTDESLEEVGVLGMIDRQFDAMTGKLDFSVRAGIDELRSAGTLLGKASMDSFSENHEFKFKLEIDLEGGNVEADYHSFDSSSRSEYNLDLHVERLEYGGLLRLLNPEFNNEGQVFVDTSLVSTAPNPDHLLEKLHGHFDMLVIPRGFETAFLDLWASNLIFALLPGGDSKEKVMNCMVARFEVEDGIMASKNTFLDSTDVIVRARGDIDLVNRKLDLWAAPQAKREKFLSVQTPIVVTGPFENPDINSAPGGFIFTMLRWYYNLIYVPFKWLTGERFPTHGVDTCFNAMGWELPGESSAAH